MVWDKDPDERNERMLEYLRKSRRLTIPIRGADGADMLEVAAILSRLAERIQYRVKGMDAPRMPLYDLLRSVEDQIDLANRDISAHFRAKGINVREGGMTLAERRERSGHRDETEQSGSIDYPLHAVKGEGQ